MTITLGVRRRAGGYARGKRTDEPAIHSELVNEPTVRRRCVTVIRKPGDRATDDHTLGNAARAPGGTARGHRTVARAPVSRARELEVKMPGNFAVTPEEVARLARDVAAAGAQVATIRSLAESVTAALGEPHVAAAFERFATGWSRRTGELREEIGALAAMLTQAAEQYTAADDAIARTIEPQ
ncbi:hypothetical protein Acel_0800 [Acidothermus cellulolyticus 11B]|uniref:Uncharacterized protein n=1 Tax=Acidothermus cellulolyticus (strain ATCC 43068 / DSM 8971 / 11B) TaxID=351607 RepID=A0LT13_ACIC1|nr:type VII secretion target [Acidothermus cellulolyticus]ABK52573.1 hypothetical protein Acel_0800 [Acidothermus cellulolyticus 11B]